MKIITQEQIDKAISEIKLYNDEITKANLGALKAAILLTRFKKLRTDGNPQITPEVMSSAEFDLRYYKGQLEELNLKLLKEEVFLTHLTAFIEVKEPETITE
jgi:hypothetical protein